MAAQAAAGGLHASQDVPSATGEGVQLFNGFTLEEIKREYKESLERWTGMPAVVGLLRPAGAPADARLPGAIAGRAGLQATKGASGAGPSNAPTAAAPGMLCSYSHTHTHTHTHTHGRVPCLFAPLSVCSL